MGWYLFFIILAVFLFVPINVRTSFKINVLKMAGEVCIKILGITFLKLKVKIKHNFVYITKKGITYKEKLTPSNINIVFLMNFISQMYFRIKLNMLSEEGECGVKENAFTTSMLCVTIDMLFKGVFAKIKNNKKASHIFLNNGAKYNEDCLNFKFELDFNVNIIDILYTLILSKIRSKGEKYERIEQREQGEIAD